MENGTTKSPFLYAEECGKGESGFSFLEMPKSFQNYGVLCNFNPAEDLYQLNKE
jgi:hypothetical protein